jgi:predicted metal-dependent hydrolase
MLPVNELDGLASSASPVLKTAQMVCAGRRVTYAIRPSRRARALSMVISPQTGVVVTVPASGYAPAALARFLIRHERWMLTYLARMADIAARIPPFWPFGPTLPYQGRRYHVQVHSLVSAGTPIALTPEGVLQVRMARPSLDGARRLLRSWYRQEALDYSQQRVRAFAPVAGVTWTRVRVGDQRRRWGSCSPRGSLNFNYRLIMAPSAVFDYVIWHELAHRRQMNHSARFWALVASLCPGYRDAVAWLRTDGQHLAL